MADEPSWEDLFSPRPERGAEQPPVNNAKSQWNIPGTGAPSSAPSSAPSNAPGSGPSSTPAGAPLTRRELRESEGYRRGTDSGSGRGRAPVDNGSRGTRPPVKNRRRRGWLWALISIVLVGALGAGAAWVIFPDQVRKVMGWELPIDYVGSGNGQPVNVTILSGQIGSDVAKSLYDAGVTMTFKSFYSLLLKQTAVSFQPGTYKLQKHMSAASALAALQDPANRVVSKVVVPEGTTLPKTLALLSKGTGIPLADLQTAAKDKTGFGIPAKAPSLEGFLFPATYSFDPGLNAKQVLQQMVDRMNKSLAAAGVAPADSLKVLTMASIIQKEGGSVKDFYKVSRVFANRIQQGMLLQSDATVSYGSGGTSISTTGAERADASNKYNTYVHPGLPVGPICAPGDAAIDAALHPAAGAWLYFVLINGDTGETKFSNTLAEHNAAVLIWQAWLRAHPNFSK